MTTLDLPRIPEVYRERAMREMSDARSRDGTSSRDVLARYLAIADKADAAASFARDHVDSHNRADPAEAARAKVWADELAKLDAPAEPPASYWSTGVAVERKADATDAAQAVRAAQRAHLDSTRAVEIATQAIVEDVGCDAEEAGGTAFAVIEALNGAGWDPIGGRPVFTGTAQTEARLDIADAAGLRVALDGVARYLAGKAPETLAAVVALLKTLPLGYAPKIDLGGCDEGAAALAVVAALPGAYTGATARDNGTPLYYAHAEVDGVEVAARHAPAPSKPSIAGPAGLDVATRAGGDR